MFEGFDGWLRVKDAPELDVKPYTVSEFISHCSFILEREFSDIYVEGEVANFKINQGKWVFFDLKDETSSVNCFLPLGNLGIALSDGMKIRIQATPRLTPKQGRFSLTVRSILPLGTGNIKKSFEELKAKMAREGLFDLALKRPLPSSLHKIGMISSTGAAGYHDFLKILDNRWGGLEIFIANTQVQGLNAPEQIIAALDFLNQRPELDLIVMVRGGGSAEDLAVFNDERLVRAIAKSRLPVLTGIGHEIDESLCDLAADLRASTPSNAAELLVPDRKATRQHIENLLSSTKHQLLSRLDQVILDNRRIIKQVFSELQHRVEMHIQHVEELKKLLDSFNPENALSRGYSIIKGRAGPYQVGDELLIMTKEQTLITEVRNVQDRK